MQQHMDTTTANLFDQVIDLPSALYKRRFEHMVGVDHLKERMLKQGMLILRPELLEQWSSQHHGDVLPVVTRIRQRSPLILLAGDVGTGKTTLAETFADAVARELNTKIRVMRLSLRSRGRGGELTAMLSMAFDIVREKARMMPAVILIIDEADSMAQSRDDGGMAHEERAGVNALIRGLDTVMTEGLRVITVMCTNRLSAIDPAIRRRAVDLYQMGRPGHDERRQVFERALAGAQVEPHQIDELARLTGDIDGRGYGYTYSDLVDRLLPSAVLAAYPTRPLTYESLKAELQIVEPTRPFADE